MSVEFPRRDVLHKPINRLAGIVPTFDTFDTNPSSPENMTDGDFTTESGEGVKTLAAAGDVGNIKFDMGTAYPVLVLIWANTHRHSGDGTLNLLLDWSVDGITYYGDPERLWLVAATDFYRTAHARFVYARYFRLRVTASAVTVSSVHHVKVAEVMALQLI